MLIWFHRSRSPKGAPKQYCRDLLQQPCTFNVLSSLGRRPARPRAAGRRGVGPVEDARRGAQGDRCLAGGDYMSQALNRQRAMGSLPEYSPPMLRPATGGPRIDGVICWNRICAVAEDRSRRNHHPGNQRPLPARVAAPVFPPFPPQEDAVVLTIPRVRSRN
jgi:hypothetical protein